MSESIPLAELPGFSDGDVVRDRFGRYLVRPPGGTRREPYTRATTLAKTHDDGGGLAPWKASLAVVGAMMQRGMRASWEALMAETGGNPWYHSEASKRECKRLVEECAAIGGAIDRRETGKALHRITALSDAGVMPEHLTAETADDVAAYHSTLADKGVVVLSEFIERMVVLDGIRAAGMPDRVAELSMFERPLIADLKCGADLSYSWQSFAVQLAIYSRADALYMQGDASDGSDDVRVPMIEVDQDNGLIIWLPAGSARCELFLVDLNAGWEAAQQALWTRSWRKADVVRAYDGQARWTSSDAALSSALEASVTQIDTTSQQSTLEAPVLRSVAENDASQPVVAVDYVSELRAWLDERIQTVGAHAQARHDLGLSWPHGCPTLRSSASHSAAQLDAIEKLLDTIERRYALVFPQPKPDPTPHVLAAFPNSTVIDNDNDNDKEHT